MIIPNSGAELLTSDQQNIKGLVEGGGYELMALKPKYLDPLVQKYSFSPDHYYL